MSTIRIGVIGFGLIGKTHVSKILESPNCELAGIADPRPSVMTELSQAGLPHYLSHDQLIDREKPDAVIIATPNQFHTTVSLDCLNAGLHLLIEKPIAHTVESGRQIVDLAEELDLVTLVGHHRRYYPTSQQAREMISNSAIGRLIGVSATWASLKPVNYFDVAWRCLPGGGPVLINLIHEIDLLRYICGEIVEVHAKTSNMARGFEVEDTAAMILTFESGAIGSFFLSDAAATPWNIEMALGENSNYPYCGQNPYRFMGEFGSFDFPNLNLWRYSDSEEPGWESPLLHRPVQSASLDPYAEQLRHFCAAILGLEEPVVTAKDGLQTLAVTMAVIESASLKKPIAI